MLPQFSRVKYAVNTETNEAVAIKVLDKVNQIVSMWSILIYLASLGFLNFLLFLF